jgi:hypothetical protein
VPPPFPVVAAPKPGKGPPPVPHVSVKTEPPEPEAPTPVADPVAVAKKKRMVIMMAGVAAVLVLGVAGFFAYQAFFPAPPPPPVAKAKAPPPKVAVAPAPAAPAVAPTAAAPATPSETLNAVAQIPGAAVRKAQGAVEARNAAGQSNVDVALSEAALADKPAVAETKGPNPALKSASAKTSVTRGVSASTEVQVASVEASPEFRSFVANAKVSGVFQGNPARAMINGRLARTGDMIDPALGIIFEGVDAAKKQLLFKDKSGAVVARKY